VLTAVVSGLLAWALVGCGAGQTAATSQKLPTVPGVNAEAGGVAVRNATVAFQSGGYPAGGDAPVELALLNTTREPVRLVQLTSEAAGSVTLASAVRVGAPAGEPTPTGGGQSGQVGDLRLAPGQLVNATLRLTGLTQPVNGTVSTPVELTFDNGAVLSLNVPMAPPLEPLPREPMTFDEEETH
jgi:copper(I)-binding protein